MEKQTVAETIKLACKIRPALKSFLDAFEPLLTQRRALAERLAPLMAEAGASVSGRPLDQPILPAELPAGLGPFIRLAAADLLPLLLELESIRPYGEKLEALFLNLEHDEDQQGLVAAMLAESPDALTAIAGKHGLEPHVVEFASEFIVSAVLRGLASIWEDEEFADWRQGLCPVCGNPPILAWLAKKPPVQNNEFLADGGGRKHLYCGMCGSSWYFLRGVCPECGTQGQDAMQILGEEDRRHERIDWCKKCRSYLPLIDLRELADVPDMDAMALSLMHLDLVASRKDLTPVKPSFWNMF